MTYDSDARPVSITRSNGITTQFTYDANSRTASIREVLSGQALAFLSLQRDAAGEVVSATRSLPQPPAPAAGVNTFSFDATDQVTSGTYDSLGRVSQDSRQSYSWNQASELTEYSGGNGSAIFTYDGLGMRLSATSAGAEQNFVWNYALDLPSIATVQSGGADRRYYIYTPDGALLYAIDATGNVRHWYHFDETGSTIFLSGDNGQITDSYGITPYGETVTATGGTPNPFTFAGKWGVMQEGRTGLYYMRMREYDSTTARFLSWDPLRSISPYEYGSQNPLSNNDPLGTKEGWGTYVKSWGDPASWSAWWSGFKEGIQDGATIVNNAATLGLNTQLSKDANEAAQQYGTAGSVMKTTAGIGIASGYLATGLAGLWKLGITNIGWTTLSQLPAAIGVTATTTATTTAAASQSPAVQEETMTALQTYETQLAETLVQPQQTQAIREVTEVTERTLTETGNSLTAPLSETLRMAWDVFYGAVRALPKGENNRELLLQIEQNIG